MQTTHFQYTLKKYRTPSDRANCPACGGRRTFAPYVDIETGQDLPARYGRCNRQDKCGYHHSPYHDGYGTDAQASDDFVPAPIRQQLPQRPVVDLPKGLLVETLKGDPSNAFVKHLLTLYPKDVVSDLRAEYLIGDHNIWPGATCFPFVSIEGYVRAIQIKQFDGSGHTGKNEDGSSRTVWIHKLVDKATHWLKAYEEQDMRLNCLFGEHLLAKYPKKDVALFEAPKTAIIAAAHFPDMVCVAVGALDWLTLDRVQALKGRRVILYPDASIDGKAFKKWQEKGKKWQHLAAFSTSSYLETTCSDEEKAKGFDFADLLERIPYVEEAVSLKWGIAENQLVAEAITRKTGISENQLVTSDNARKETNGWEIRTPEKMHSDTPIEPEIRLPKLMEAETTVSVPTSIDIAEYRQWAKKLGPFPKGQFVRLNSMADDAPYNIVFNPRAFAMGRLNSIAAWANAKNDSGPKSRHIRQVIELRQILSSQINQKQS